MTNSPRKFRDSPYRRIEAARASRRFPRLLEMLREGRLSLATVCLLAPSLSASNVDDLLSQATHKSKREVEALLARLHPKPPVPSVLRKLPVNGEGVDASRDAATRPPDASAEQRAADGPQPLPVTETCERTLAQPDPPRRQPVSRLPVVVPLFEAHYKAAEVWRPRTPTGPPEVKGRYVPASVKRAVWRRDEGRCAFVSDDRRRCDATGALEFHHVRPYTVGAGATSANIEIAGALKRRLVCGVRVVSAAVSHPGMTRHRSLDDVGRQA